MGGYVETISECSLWGVDFLMIFVMLGSQDKSFKRLLNKIDDLMEKGIINEEVVVQAGNTSYKSHRMQILKFLSQDELIGYIESASYIISHGGVGSIIDSLKKNKKVIAVPRLAKFKEHVNDHQIQIIDEFSKNKNIIGCQGIEDLENAISKISEFKPHKYTSNNMSFNNLIDSYII